VDTPVRAIETTGVIDEKSQLRLDAPLPVVGPSRVRVIVLIPEEECREISESEWLYTAATNPAFEFLKEPEEDIYTLADGRPFDQKRNNCVTCRDI
jgi:hypothetical protein